MTPLPASLDRHRVRVASPEDVVRGRVRWSPAKSLWFAGMALGAIVGGTLTFTWAAFLVFVVGTGFALLFGHSLGSHRKLIHDAYECPRWLELFLVWCGVQVGLAGPLGLLRQHDLRDYAQRLPDCHDYLRHGRGFWRDAWWQLHCELQLDHPPELRLEPRVAHDRALHVLEATWRLQQVPPALLLFALGGWGFVFWGVCARVTAGVLGHWLIGWFAHNRGGMHHEVTGAAVQGRNIPFTSLLTMGESWHNNHHAFPGSARLGLYPGEWDPGWWTLLALRRIGLVSRLRLPGHLPPRPELVPLDAPARGVASVDATERRPSVRTILTLCLQGPPARSARCRFEGPSLWLSPQAMAWLAGPSVTYVRTAGAPRVTLAQGAWRASGLEALCVVVAQRGGLGSGLGLLLAPLAIAFERTLRLAAGAR